MIHYIMSYKGAQVWRITDDTPKTIAPRVDWQYIAGAGLRAWCGMVAGCAILATGYVFVLVVVSIVKGA
jgi:hypothetical protein